MKLRLIEAGKIVTTHGIRGEVKVLPWVDSPEFLLNFKRICINGVDYAIENCRIQKTCNLMKLKNVDTVEAAQLLRGKTVEIYREDVPGDVIFAAELMDMKVIADGVEIGKITDVLDYPGNKVYVVSGEHEYMIPAVKEYVQSIDLDADVMQVRIIEGMRTDEG